MLMDFILVVWKKLFGFCRRVRLIVNPPTRLTNLTCITHLILRHSAAQAGIQASATTRFQRVMLIYDDSKCKRSRQENRSNAMSMAYSPSTQQQGRSTKLQLYHLPLSRRLSSSTLLTFTTLFYLSFIFYIHVSFIWKLFTCFS